MNSPISIRDLSFRRGAYSLSIPQLSADPGTVIGLVGRNGAGKTTLLELIAGLLAPHAGDVRTFGLDPVAEPVRVRQRLALMTDDQPLFDLKIRDHLWALAGFYPTWDPVLVADLMIRFELDGARRVTALSKGEGTKFRLLIAMAIQPQVLLLDEPATGLDVPSRRKMLSTVLDVVRDPNRTVIISSHDAPDLERIADRIVVLDAGRVIADGPTDQVVGPGRTLEDLLAKEST